ncbi:MAG: TlpA disulfide reductase family protein [Burkholderiaceae bacterium]|jgi:peroxiredoxin
MRASTIVIAFSAMLAGNVLAQEVGKSAPSFDVPGTAANVRLADMKGKVVYVDFWASWCAPCKQSFPWMNDMQAKYGARGLQIVGITVDRKREDAEKFLASTPAKFMVAFDTTGKVAEAYKPKGMPTSYLIGADGVLRAMHVGFKDSDRAELEREIEAALTAAKK